MKKNKKRILGLFGLFVVVAMVGIAIMLPDPRAEAATSVTDTIKVRVVGTTPTVDITGIPDGAFYNSPERNFTVDFANIDKLELVLVYTDLAGNVLEDTIHQSMPEDVIGAEDFVIRLVSE